MSVDIVRNHLSFYCLMPFLAPSCLKPHPLHFLVEPFFDDPSYIERPMFGCRACYLYGRMVLVLACPGEDPWNGILFPTERKYHASLSAEFQSLRSHSILGKWLYLAEDDPNFESTATKIVRLIMQGDPRLGIVPKKKKARAAGSKKLKERAPRRHR